MITKKRIKLYCCEDPCLIENYDKAIADTTQIWHCHHRLEIQGDKILSIQELIDQGLYYNRPASELIFLTRKDHTSLHGNNKSKETLIKSGIASRKRKPRAVSEETKQKIRATLKAFNSKLTIEERKYKYGHKNKK